MNCVCHHPMLHANAYQEDSSGCCSRYCDVYTSIAASLLHCAKTLGGQESRHPTTMLLNSSKCDAACDQIRFDQDKYKRDVARI